MDDMTPSDLQRKIAELKGWTDFHDERRMLMGKPPVGLWHKNVPNWPTDLTLAWQLEEELNEEEKELYVHNLFKVVRGDVPPLWAESRFRLAHATAAQRCEAWCKVKETK